MIFLAVGGGAAAAAAALAVVMGTSGVSQQLTPVPSLAYEFRGNHLHGLAYVPEDDGLYLASHYGLFVLRDRELFQVGDVRDDLMGFSRHPREPGTFYASGHPRTGGNLGVVVSQDGGMSWARIFAGIGDEVVDFHSMVASPADPERLYGVFADALYVGDMDAGEWHAAGAAGAAGITLAGACWGVPCLAAAADDRDRLFAGTPDGLFVSADAGESWRRLSGGLGGVAGVGAHPAAPDVLMAHTGALGIARSEDGGASWTSRSRGIELHPRDFVFGFAFDPADHDRAFAASAHGLVFETGDGGASWRMVLGPDGPPS